MKIKLIVLALFCLIQLNVSAQTWLKLSCGTEFSVALRSDSTLWAWGANMNGQLGIGSLTTAVSPVQIGTEHKWKDIVAGAIHCLAIKSDGTLWAWGLNGNGQLGNGNNVNSSSPVQIGIATNWAKIYAGQAHSFAIKTDGSLWAWGHNYYGQLGDSSNIEKNFPVQIGSETNWKDISGGGFHTLAIKTNGSLWAWGYNGEGELGDSTTTNDSIPKQIGTDTNWSTVAAGTMYSLGLKADGSIWAWGFNGNGQLGIGGNTKLSKSTMEIQPVMIGEAYDWKSIAAASSFAFAIKNDSSLWGWGFNYYGQLGNGTSIQVDYPVKSGTENNWKSIAASVGFYYNSAVYGMHSMGLKYQHNGICVSGANYTGQLGNGSLINMLQFDCSIGMLSVSEITINTVQRMYPNPAKDFITIETSAEEFQLSIINSVGQTVFQQHCTSSQNTIDIQSYPQGMYYYKLVSDKGKVISGKFVKE